MAGDQEERNLEVVKLRIAFLQHITTLSGAATLIILAIMQRTKDPLVLSKLASLIIIPYAFAAIIAVLGIVFLINTLERADLPLRRSTGRYATIVTSIFFAVGTVFVIIISTRVTVVRFIISAAGWVAILVVLYFVLRSRSSEPEANGEDPDTTPGP